MKLILRSQYKPSMKKYSRLYGFKNDNNKIPYQIPDEVKIIKTIFELFCSGNTPGEIKQFLDENDLRTRIGYRWTEKQIVGLVKPIYAGLIDSKFWMLKSNFYLPIVSSPIYRKARKNLKSSQQTSQNEASLNRQGAVIKACS